MSKIPPRSPKQFDTPSPHTSQRYFFFEKFLPLVPLSFISPVFWWPCFVRFKSLPTPDYVPMEDLSPSPSLPLSLNELALEFPSEELPLHKIYFATTFCITYYGVPLPPFAKKTKTPRMHFAFSQSSPILPPVRDFFHNVPLFQFDKEVAGCRIRAIPKIPSFPPLPFAAASLFLQPLFSIFLQTIFLPLTSVR